MNIIVTGGAGFIGCNFVYYELEKHPEDRIICLDKLTYAGNLKSLDEAMKSPSFRFVRGDICDRETVEKLFEEEHPDIVVNFAAESHVDRSVEDPGLFLGSEDIIRCPPMRYMETCRWTGPTCSLPSRRIFIPQAPIRHLRRVRTCWCWPITGPSMCR